MPQSNAQPFKPPISNYEEHLFSNNSSLEVFHLSSQSDFPDAVVVLDGAGDDVRDLLRHHPDRTPLEKKRQTALNEVVETNKIYFRVSKLEGRLLKTGITQHCEIFFDTILSLF